MNEELINQVIKRYTSVLGLILQNIVILLYSISIVLGDNFNLIVNENINYKVIFCVIIIFVIFILLNLMWVILNIKWPKSNSSKQSIIICLDSNNYDDYSYIKKIIIRKFKNKIESSYGDDFEVLFLPYYASKRVLKKDRMVQKALFLEKYHIVIYGVIERGNKRNQPTVKLELDILARTIRLDPNIENSYKKDLEKLVDKYFINESNDLQDSEETVEELILILEYVVGLTSLLSNNYNYSYKIFEKLYFKIKNIRRNRKVINYIKSRIDRTYGFSILTSASDS